MRQATVRHGGRDEAIDSDDPGAAGRTGGGSARMTEIALRFGVSVSMGPAIAPAEPAIPTSPGSLTLISGPSGSGKSTLLRAVARAHPTARLVQTVPFPSDVPVVDAIAPTRPVDEAIGVLTACGLGEPALWLRRFSELSEGEQFRARLARAVSLVRRETGDRPGGKCVPLLCDEFGSNLHRRLARALAFNLRKLTTRERLALVVATSHDDLEQDLSPDRIVRPGGARPCVEEFRRPAAEAVSFASSLRIERGTYADYSAFSSMHYRGGGHLGFVDKVFVCRDGLDGPVLGVAVYAYPTLELKVRNHATGRRFCRRPDCLNRELRLLKRLIVHPDVRGCGIGHWFVRRTLPLVGTRFVECLTAMGAVNPVFEKAGMRRIGWCEPPSLHRRAVAELRAAGVDPGSADFVSQVCRRPAVRRIVAAAVLKWYRATSGKPTEQFAGRTPSELARTFRQLMGSEPVYYLWAADEAGRHLIEDGIDREELGLAAATSPDDRSESAEAEAPPAETVT